MSIGGGGSTSSQRSYSGMTPIARGYQRKMIKEFYPYIGQPLEMYGGQMTAEMTPEQMESARIGRETLRGLTTIDPVQVQERYQKYLAPQVREMYGGPGGYYSSERFGAEQQGMERYLMGREQQAVEAAQALSGYETTGLGGLGRRIEQEKLTADLQEWLRTRPEYSPYIQYMLDLMGLGVSYGRQRGESWDADVNISSLFNLAGGKG